MFAYVLLNNFFSQSNFGYDILLYTFCSVFRGFTFSNNISVIFIFSFISSFSFVDSFLYFRIRLKLPFPNQCHIFLSLFSDKYCISSEVRLLYILFSDEFFAFKDKSRGSASILFDNSFRIVLSSFWIGAVAVFSMRLSFVVIIVGMLFICNIIFLFF